MAFADNRVFEWGMCFAFLPSTNPRAWAKLNRAMRMEDFESKIACLSTIGQPQAHDP